MGWESTEQSKWERLATVVNPGANRELFVLPTDACNRVKLRATRRSEAGIGFRDGQRKLKLRMTDRHVMGST